MSELKTEEEQIEAFKAWWKKNGVMLITAIAVAVAGYFGFQSWKSSQENHITEASALYQNLVQASANLSSEDNKKTVSFLADQLINDYGDTSYAMFGQLFLARLNAENAQYDDAIQLLESAIDSVDDASFIAIANLRIARLLLQKQDNVAAMARANQVSETAFTTQKQELIGDIYLSQGNREEARVAYQAASDALVAGVNHPLLDIKLRDLVKN